MAITPAFWRRLDLSARILIGLAAGVCIGLFFGEPAAVLQPVVDIYIRLMQMTVLPYLVVSLVIAFGQLEVAQAKRLALRGGALLLLVWGLTALVIVAFPRTFPGLVSASFYSELLVEPRQPFSFTDIFFTDNPFDSLSRSLVPAVVLFSSLVGIGLMGLKDKEKLLAPMRIWNAAIVRVTHFVIELTPYGVLAIGAVTAGTMTLETLQHLEVYFIVFAAAALLLAFWILPLLVTAVTPFSYREVNGIARDALLTAFIANSAFIVLPILIERSKQLLARHGLLDESADATTEVMIPVMFNFPNAGRLLTLLFIPYAAWSSGVPMPSADYLQLVTVGIPSYFAKAQVALPFLLDLLSLPHDLFELYIPATIVTGKFDSLVTAVNLIVFALLAAGAMGGKLVFKASRLLRAALSIVVGSAAVVMAVWLLLATAIDTDYHLDRTVRQMKGFDYNPDTVVHRAPVDPADDPATPALQRIRERGSIRIGYDERNLPMSFFNDNGELVGFDIALGESLARALKVRAEFVPIQWSQLSRMLTEGVVDLMPGVWYRPYWFGSLRLSEPYLTGTIGFAVLDHRRHEFNRIDALRSSEGLVVGVPLDSTQIETSMRHYFGEADITFRVIEFWEPYFRGEHPDVDAFLMPVENASGWSLLYPQYTVVVPQPDPIRVPSAFGMARNAGELATVVNEWVVFAENAGLIRQAYEYWVLGKGAKKTSHRWSVFCDVLGRGECRDD